MSGHSKWATTKHRKGAKDSARAKVFAKLIRQVEVAAREGGGDAGAEAVPDAFVPDFEAAVQWILHGHDRSARQLAAYSVA